VLNQKRIMVPVSLGPEGLRLLDARPEFHVTRYDPAITPSEFHALLADTAAIALSWTRFDAAAIAAAPHLQVAARVGVGFDAVDVPGLTARGIPLMVVGSANSRAVAEHAVFLMFALTKRAMEMHRRVRTGVNHDRKSGLPGEVAGKTVLVVGFGRIGSRTAPRCKALEMEVLVYDPYVAPEVIRAAGYEPAPDLEAALPRADFVTIHCPKNSETLGMFNAARMARMKPGAFLINTARGGIVDEAALADALSSRHLAGAGLDVFDPEPPLPSNPLLAMENVIASPHLAGVTTEAWAAMSAVTVENMLGVLDGTPTVAHAVNPEVFG
jgi:D-3-phosphoglycerate dehydrogenase